MAIVPGRRLGPYEILFAIGAGGMGEVYKARDTRLDRIVAIKVLPTHLADRAELRERFEREAKTIASLNHPHICTLYDTGHQDGVDYLVMEYLEGETLAQRLLKGSLPLEQVLQDAIEISDALDKAHRKGITHRDLKPGNIMLTKSGTKLLDFGLAKLAQDAAPVTPESQMPTMKDAITAQGTILGTLQYMAPEQVEGKLDQIDARTDIFAFGVVVYEMATGKKAFEGKSQASLMAKILETDPPPISMLAPMTPPALDRVVKKCLAKDSDKRWQSASDVCDELRWIAETGSQASLSPSVPARKPLFASRTAMIALAGIVLGAAVATIGLWNRKPPSAPQLVSRFVLPLPAGQNLEGVAGGIPHSLVVSPDGSQIAYVALRDGTDQIFLRSIDSLESRAVPGTEVASLPFFSPDSQWLGFFTSDLKLEKASVSGGPPVTICDLGPYLAQGSQGYAFGAAWSSRGEIIVGSYFGLLEVPDSGGALKPLSGIQRGNDGYFWPQFLPGGTALLFVTGTRGNPQIAVYSMQTGKSRMLVTGSDPAYSPTGHLIYSQAGALMAAPFDSQRLEVTGPATPVVQGLTEYSANGQTTPSADFSVSANGTLVYAPGVARNTPLRMVWVSRNGAAQPLSAPARVYVQPRISPDGRKIAVGVSEKDSQIWIYDVAQGAFNRLTFQGTNNLVPLWTPDGKRVAYISNQAGQRNIFWQFADGSGGLERLTTSPNLDIPNSFSPDGKLLAFSETTPSAGYDILLLGLADRKPRPFLQTPHNEAVPLLSPDGRWMAYVSDESGRNEIYVVSFPGPGGKWQISTGGGREPAWNRNGRELFYRNGDKMMAVEINTQSGFSAGTPRVLFQGPYQTLTASTPNYDVSADGQRFLMLEPTEQPAQINVVLNWFEELKQKVPTWK
jgi:eukaryotic-like serine/threonine-protein kinase